MTGIKPHGGELINRLVPAEQREELLELAASLKQIRVNSWTISDLDLIAVGAFSPLIGFLDEANYNTVVETMRLTDGTVWSIPITLSIPPEVAASITVGEQVVLVGDEDGVPYAILDTTSIYNVDHANEAMKVFKTNDMAHPGVDKLFARSSTNIGGSIQMLSRPKPKKF